MGSLLIRRKAVISPDTRFRYTLVRQWSTKLPMLCCIGLNPSTADGMNDDATLRVVCGRAKRLGMGGVWMLNCFALRSTDPSVLIHQNNSMNAIGPRNDEYIAKTLARSDINVVLAAWGDNGKLYGRAFDVLQLCRTAGRPVMCLGLTNGGSPRHPLRIPYSQDLMPLGGW